MPRDGDWLDRIEWEHQTPSYRCPNEHMLYAHHPDHERAVGHISWFDDDGEVAGIDVEREHRRKGLATHMWSRAKQITPHLMHSPDQTADGKAWAPTTGSRRPFAVSKIAKASKEPQGCQFCSEPATRSYLWAEGMGYIPACDAHEGKARTKIHEIYDGDEPDAVHEIKKAATVEQRALARLAQMPDDLIQGRHLHRLLADHGIHLHEEDPWEAGEIEGDPMTGDTGVSVHHAPDAELHTSQNNLWRPTLRHFIEHPGESGTAERPSTWEHEGRHWINGGHHRIVADRMAQRAGTTVSDRTPKTAEAIHETMDRLRRQQWDPVRAEHQAVHRGFGAELSDEDHELIHDSSRPLHERATRLMQHVTKGNLHGEYTGSGLGIHWTTDGNVAHHFSKVDAAQKGIKYDEDADGERYGHNADGFPRQRPETRVVLHAHFPEHEHIAHEEEDQDGAFGYHERNTVQHSMNGGGVDFEREVPIKRGQPVRVHAISWGLTSHRTDDQVAHDHETTRYDLPEALIKKAYRPTKRIFGPTYGLDDRVFDGDHLRKAVRYDLMAKWHRFCGEQLLRKPDEWSIVYFAGSEASEWTSPERKGNNDFDVLVGVSYEKFVAVHGPGELIDMGAEDENPETLAHELTSRMRESLADPAYVLPGSKGDPGDPWDQTWFCNENSYSIKDIKPYAAYDVTHDCWAVRPPHLPDWDIEKFPEGHALVEMGDAYDALVDAILKLPEPYKTQQGNALWEHLHSDRGRAFGPDGEGWFDPANVIEKWLDQEGTWKDLWELHHRAEEDPTTLRAPADWSNDPAQTRA